MNLVKTSVLSAISNAIKLITAFLTNKLLAYYFGPAGLAFIGQFQNFVNIVITFSNSGINSGIVKYVSEFSEEKEKRDKYINTSFVITIFSSILSSLTMIVFCDSLSIYLLKDVSYSYVFKTFSIAVILLAINTFWVSVLNGLKEVKKVILVNIFSSIFSALFTIFLVYFYKMQGAIISYITSQSAVFFITAFFCLKNDWFKSSASFTKYDKEAGKNLFKYSLMAVVTALTANYSQIFIRNYVMTNLSVDNAGYWQGMMRLSELYLLFITTTFSVYYLPRLSEIKDNETLRKEILNGYKIILPILACINFGIYLFRDFIIIIVFSDKFLPMRDLFMFQMIGDFFKIFSWLLGFLMIAKAMTKEFIITEILFSFCFVVLSIFFVKNFSLQGLSLAHLCNYMLYSLAMIFIFRKVLFPSKST